MSIPEGYSYFSIYRNTAIYENIKPETEYQYAAGSGDTLTVFDHSFKGIRDQLDEIHSAGCK